MSLKQNAIKQIDIELESMLLKLLSNKTSFDRFYPVLEKKKLIPTTQQLLSMYDKYYKKYGEDIDWNIFYTEVSQNWSGNLDEHDLTYYRETVFPLIQNAEHSDVLYAALLEREASKRISDIILDKFDLGQIETITKELKDKLSVYRVDDENIFKLHNLDLSVLDVSNGISWALPSLQAALNSLMSGQFIVIGADSNTGKSAFCITQAVHTFRELNNKKSERPILYATSEDTKEDLAARFLSCLYKDRCPGGFEEIVASFNKVVAHYSKNYNTDLFVGVQIRGPNDLNKIKDLVEKVNPALIIIDMLDKLSPSDNIQDLTKLYQEIRGIANSGYPVIGTSQSGNTSYQDKESGEFKHRKWLTDKDLANSKSGKQGAAYCMIMIGKDDQMTNIRYLSTTKKKRGKEVSVTCELLESHSLYKELI